MTTEQAQSAITLSALVTTGMFAYRKVTEPELAETITAQPGFLTDYKAIFGAAPLIGWGQFLKGAGSLYIVLAIMGAASPDIGGTFAILVGTGAALGNLVAVRADLARNEAQAKAAEQAVRSYKPVSTGQPPTSGNLVRRLV